MKKIKYILLVLMLFPAYVFASEIDYEITKFHIEANINENGSADVCEFIEQTGTFNGYIRELRYKSDNDYEASNITNVKVYDLNTSNLTKGEEFSLVEKGTKGQRLVYEQSIVYGGIDLTMYNASNDSKRGYVVCYTLENVAISHNDVGEFYWNFIGEDFDDVLNDVVIRVNLNKKDETLRVWAHGPLYGEIHPYHNDISYAEAKIDFVNPNNPVDIRMTFSLENIPNSTKKSYKEALPEILQEEQERADIANKEREQAKNILIAKIVLGITYFIIMITIFIYSYIKYDKERKVIFNHQYLREFPNTYGPETLQYLNKKSADAEAYSASILEIIRKKALKVENVNGDNKKYKLVLNTPTELLTPNENSVLTFIINEIGNGSEVELDTIKKYGKRESTARNFINNFEMWKNSVTSESEKYNFFEKNKNGLLIFIIIALTALVAFIEFNDFPALGIIIIIIGVISLIYQLTIKKRTESGALEYQKWQAFKRFLEDFGRFDEKELPEIVLWEKYLVYATVLGVADKLQKTMKIKLNEMNYSTDYTDIYLTHYMLTNDLNRTINSTINNAINVSRSTIAASQASSGSGSGGGFSSGGGFGGGGGGGHGF